MSITKEYRNEMARRHRERTSWGNSAKNYGGADVLGLVDRFPNIKTILDFGCGKGTMKQYVEARTWRKDLRWTEYDPGIPGKDTPPQKRFDMVLSCDVLEHIEPEELPNTLVQLADWTGTLSYHNIACTPTGRAFGPGPFEGRDIHMCVEQPDWWLDITDRIFGDDFELWEYRNCLRRSKHNKYRERATIVHERVGNVR